MGLILKPKLKYPKFLILTLTFVFAYMIFTSAGFETFRVFISSLGYFGAFLAGIMYAYGFTAAIATSAFLIIGKTNNIGIAGILGGLGALVGDLVIFKIINHNFDDEIELLANEKWVIFLRDILPDFFKKFTAPIIGAIVIASPIPDEIGVSLIAITKLVSERTFIFVSYILNTFGILLLLFLGTKI